VAATGHGATIQDATPSCATEVTNRPASGAVTTAVVLTAVMSILATSATDDGNGRLDEPTPRCTYCGADDVGREPTVGTRMIG